MQNCPNFRMNIQFHIFCQIFAKLFAKKTWRGGPTIVCQFLALFTIFFSSNKYFRTAWPDFKTCIFWIVLIFWILWDFQNICFFFRIDRSSGPRCYCFFCKFAGLWPAINSQIFSSETNEPKENETWSFKLKWIIFITIRFEKSRFWEKSLFSLLGFLRLFCNALKYRIPHINTLWESTEISGDTFAKHLKIHVIENDFLGNLRC